MNTTLTIRLSRTQRQALRRFAVSQKLTESALLRQMINRELRRGFDFERVRHLAGSIGGTQSHWQNDPWRKHIRARNWR